MSSDLERKDERRRFDRRRRIFDRRGGGPHGLHGPRGPDGVKSSPENQAWVESMLDGAAPAPLTWRQRIAAWWRWITGPAE